MKFNFLAKIKNTKKLALQKNIHSWYNCVLQSVLILFIASTVLSVYTIEAIFGVDDTTPINDLPMIMLITPFLFTMALSYVFLEKLIIIHIFIYEKIHKIIFKAWQNFDMWYFRRYRKHSPITEYLSKLQAKQAKLGKNKKRLIVGLLIAGIILLNLFVRIPLILDSIEPTATPVIDQEQQEEIPENNDSEYQIIVRGIG